MVTDVSDEFDVPDVPDVPEVKEYLYIVTSFLLFKSPRVAAAEENMVTCSCFWVSLSKSTTCSVDTAAALRN